MFPMLPLISPGGAAQNLLSGDYGQPTCGAPDAGIATRGIAEKSRFFASHAAEAVNEKGGPPGRLRVGEIASVDLFDHPALARVDQIGSVFSVNIAVFTQ